MSGTGTPYGANEPYAPEKSCLLQPITELKSLFLSSSRKERIHLPILFLNLKTAQAYDNSVFLCITKTVQLTTGC